MEAKKLQKKSVVQLSIENKQLTLIYIYKKKSK